MNKVLKSTKTFCFRTIRVLLRLNLTGKDQAVRKRNIWTIGTFGSRIV